MKIHSFVILAVFLICSMVQTASLQAAAPAAPAASDADAERKAKSQEARKQAMADPDVKAAFAGAKAAADKANHLVSLKMIALDPSISPLLEQKKKQTLSSSDKDKLALLRKQASADPQIKTELDLAKAAKKDADQKLLAKIHELDPSLASAGGKKDPKAGRSAGRSDGKTPEPPASTSANTTSSLSATNSTAKIPPAK